jgi:AcrR family transcriptional regulator
MKRDAANRRRPSTRVREKRRRARQEILEVARRQLDEGGAEAVTLESVAGDLGMTKQALYHYFPSKEALNRSLVTSLIDDEVEILIAAIDAADAAEATLAVLIRAFYNHYIENLNAFRAVYCQTQLQSSAKLSFDQPTLHEEINPRTQHLFDVLENRLAGRTRSAAKRERLRRLAYTAWTSALGLVTMLGVADALDDPLLHSDQDLLDTLTRVFGTATA